jgi:hypothetical protein
MPRALLRCDPDCSGSLDGFLRRLGATVAWCLPRANPADPRGCLRHDYLRPRPLSPNYFAAVGHVASSREHKLGRDRRRHEPPLAGGRLLVYFPDADLSDGAAELETNGYFDVFNTPPWDTWVAFASDGAGADSSYGNYLVAWVPPVFLGAAAAGIDVNPEQCIAWLEDADVGLARLLRERAPSTLWT